MGSFEDFDWEHDERWLAHLRKLELLDPALLAKARAKWYKREIVSLRNPSLLCTGSPASAACK